MVETLMRWHGSLPVIRHMEVTSSWSHRPRCNSPPIQRLLLKRNSTSLPFHSLFFSGNSPRYALGLGCRRGCLEPRSIYETGKDGLSGRESASMNDQDVKQKSQEESGKDPVRARLSMEMVNLHMCSIGSITI